MKMNVPGKRVILAIHRWAGAFAALFLVLLSVTGLCLNHAETLGFHDTRITWSFILQRYNMLSSGDIRSVRIGDSHTLSILDDGLYFDANYIVESGELAGVFEDGKFLAVAAENGLIILSREGELVEMLTPDQLPFDDLKLIGMEASGKAVLVAGNANWIADDDWLEFREFNGDFTVLAPRWTDLDKTAQDAILLNYQGQGPTVYRVLLDLHSGRLFGWGGRTVMDLTALAILILVSTGVTGWLRKSHRPRISFN